MRYVMKLRGVGMSSPRFPPPHFALSLGLGRGVGWVGTILLSPPVPAVALRVGWDPHSRPATPFIARGHPRRWVSRSPPSGPGGAVEPWCHVAECTMNCPRSGYILHTAFLAEWEHHPRVALAKYDVHPGQRVVGAYPDPSDIHGQAHLSAKSPPSLTKGLASNPACQCFHAHAPPSPLGRLRTAGPPTPASASLVCVRPRLQACHDHPRDPSSEIRFHSIYCPTFIYTIIYQFRPHRCTQSKKF